MKPLCQFWWIKKMTRTKNATEAFKCFSTEDSRQPPTHIHIDGRFSTTADGQWQTDSCISTQVHCLIMCFVHRNNNNAIDMVDYNKASSNTRNGGLHHYQAYSNTSQHHKQWNRLVLRLNIRIFWHSDWFLHNQMLIV